MKKYFLTIFVVFCLSLNMAAASSGQRNIAGSIVKIYTVYNKHSYYRPWQMMGQQSGYGSGCIIKGNRILTNAHVVADATFLQVKRAGIAKKYVAEVHIVAHECDLAILNVKDKSFFSGAYPIEIGKLPAVGDKVATYGFPQGGDELAFTEGVVSRVEHHEYAQSKSFLLCCQIDAAINPGSSGGPVIKDDKIAGVAFQATEGENIGYMVPVPIIAHFFKDIEDGKYDGIPSLGISWQKIENPDMRQFYSMGEQHTGVLINKVYPDSPVKGILKPGDIILSIEGIDVANDGTIDFRENERTYFGYVYQDKYIGNNIEFEVLRNGDISKTNIELTIPTNYCRLVPHTQYDREPSYYVVGGLVFQKLTKNYLDVRFNDIEYYSENFFNLFPYYKVGEPTEERRQIIVLASVLADDLNVGYHELKDIVINKVNGKNVPALKALVRAVEENTGKYHVFETEGGNKIVLDRNKTEKRHKIILDRYKVPSGSSEDLKEL